MAVELKTSSGFWKTICWGMGLTGVVMGCGDATSSGEGTGGTSPAVGTGGSDCCGSGGSQAGSGGMGLGGESSGGAGDGTGGTGATGGSDGAGPLSPLSSGCPELGGSGTVHEINDADEFEAALASAVAGDTIRIATDIDETLSVKSKKYDAENPLWIVADDKTVDSLVVENSSGVNLGGIRFASLESSSLLKVVNSQNVKVLRSTFDHAGVQEGQSAIVTTQASSAIEIGCNLFKDMAFAGANSGSFVKTQWDEPELTKNLHIHHNHFKNIAPVVMGNSFDGDSDREAIVLGISDTQDIVTHHVIEFNLFEDCDGENEIITVKTSENIIRHNTFVNNLGSVSVRFGSKTDIHGNFFFANADNKNAYPNDTGGIRVYGQDHRIYNNYFDGLTGDSYRVPINVDGGDTSDSTGGDGHERPTNISVVNNTLVNCSHGIGLGTHYNLAPQGTTIANNLIVGTGSTMFEIGAESDTTYVGNIGFGSEPGRTFSEAELTVTDPALADDGSWFRTPSTSPAKDAGSAAYAYITEDIEGQARQSIDVGADEFSMEAPTHRPLTHVDVGPAAKVMAQ